MSSEKGDRRERELVNLLDESGYTVMRAPASGSATQRELPDVLAGNGETFYAIEAKSSAGPPIYLDNEEVYGLVYFSKNFGAKPRVGVRFDQETWYFFHPDDLHQTDGGNYRVKKETAIAEGVEFDEFVGHSEKIAIDDIGPHALRTGSTAGEHTTDSTARGDTGGGTGSTGDAGESEAVRRILEAIRREDLSIDEGVKMLRTR